MLQLESSLGAAEGARSKECPVSDASRPADPPDPADSDLPSQPVRRRFLVTAGALAGIAGMMVGGPAAVLFAAPLFREKGPVEEQWIPVGPADTFPEGQMT